MARRGSYAKGIAKREEILTTALEVIARNGYRRTSVKELADAVGLSQAGLLHYFSSKDELFQEILRKRDEADQVAWGGESGAPAHDDTAAGGTLASRLERLDQARFIEGFIAIMRHNADVPGLVQLYARLSADATDPEHPAHAFFVDRSKTFRRYGAEALRRLQEAGELAADVDPDLTATSLIALADGLQTQWLLDPDVDMAAHIEAFVDQLRAPAAADPAPAPASTPAPTPTP
ncbi:transcriptional regulator, TetR family [Agromyces sp. CF514]|uniref:TetR/AcrR family transcriptional regulator n=1 Tax=Agromyces sp. CF514 TaxID=1881031 RepID=UPI0008F35143|nr:TetR/AcrR family transcriptional regulator [Agromyces sp. CF514]SFR68471.1 transcriptional regulator, TetR family [Agromyces sp. CF514]